QALHGHRAAAWRGGGGPAGVRRRAEGGSRGMSGERLRLGFIALNDAAALIVADALGWFAAEGLEVELVREGSWATMRDKLAVGALDGGHLLAPLAIAMSLGVPGGEPVSVAAPMALNLNGPAVTL